MLVIKCQGGKRKRKEVEDEENCIIQLHALLGNRLVGRDIDRSL